MTSWRIIFRDKAIIFACFVCFIGFSFFAVWSSFAHLAEGVVAYGNIVSENDRKTVQHLEGGIIEEILIREGDEVEVGAPLMILTDVAALSGRNQTAQSLVNAKVSADRLNALLNGQSWQPFSDQNQKTFYKDLNIDETEFKNILTRQRNLFRQQIQAYIADISVLEKQRNNFIDSANAKQGQIDSLSDALNIVRKDLQLHKKLLAEKLTSAGVVTRLERDEATFIADISRLRAEQEAAKAHAGEMVQQIAQTRAHFRENVNRQLVEERTKISEAQGQLVAAQDVINRKTIYAPQSGDILNLKFSTKGGIVRPGEAILEIVPRTQKVIAVLEIKPSDRDVVYTGLDVNTRLSGLNNWRAPMFVGEVLNVSADLKTSPRGDYNFYEARVLLNAVETDEDEVEIIPGMPVESFVVSGHSRTLFEYLWEPISGTLRRGVQG